MSKRTLSTDPNERDLRNISQILLDKLVLDIMRTNADTEGRLVCSPSLPDFLEEELSKRGYTNPLPFRWDYNTTYSRLKRLRLIVRLSGKSGKSIAVFRIDMTTSYQDALTLSKQPNKLLCSDIIDSISDPNIPSSTITQLLSQVIEKDELIATQAATIDNLNTAIQNSLQEAEKFVKVTRKRLKQA
jgi:hypothetical protein